MSESMYNLVNFHSKKAFDLLMMLQIIDCTV